MKIIVRQTQQGYEYEFLQHQSIDQGIFYYLETPYVVTLCDHCERNISQTIKIISERGDYCVGCFANLQNLQGYYRVMNHLDVILFDKNWSAEQQLLLLQGTEKIGFDWQEIGDEMQLEHEPQQIQQHYENYYLNNEKLFGLGGVQNIERFTRISQQWKGPQTQSIYIKQECKRQQLQCQINLLHQSKRSENTQLKIERKQKTRKRTIFQWVQKNSQIFNLTPSIEQTSQKELIDVFDGYRKRGEFDREYDNEAELLLSEMEFIEGQPEHIRIMKKEIIEIYLDRLQVRNSIKDFALNHELFNLQAMLQKNRQINEIESKLDGMMKVFTRLLPKKDYQELIKKTASSIELERRIAELKKYKSKGLKTFSQIEKYEQQPQKKYEWKLSELIDKKYEFKTRKGYKTLQKILEADPFISEQDEQFCLKFRITNLQFALIRSIILVEKMKNPNFSKKELADVFSFDLKVVKEIYNHMQRNDDFNISKYIPI